MRACIVFSSPNLCVFSSTALSLGSRSRWLNDFSLNAPPVIRHPLSVLFASAPTLSSWCLATRYFFHWTCTSICICVYLPSAIYWVDHRDTDTQLTILFWKWKVRVITMDQYIAERIFDFLHTFCTNCRDSALSVCLQSTRQTALWTW